MKKSPLILLFVISLVSFYLAGQQHRPLLESRKVYELNQTEPVENAPPMVAFTTVALGGFRGLIADALWLRVSSLQQEGRFFELVQLSDWITKLEPRFSAVWAFHAWNMSYNVSVMFTDPEDRWRWVRHGISLLRDEGLYYNKGDAVLYRELGWLYQHKMGATADNEHWFYKKAWSEEMEKILPGGVFDPNLLDVPKDVATFSVNPDHQKIMDILREKYGAPFPTVGKEFEAYSQTLGELDEPGVEAYKAFLRRHSLEKIYKMDLNVLQELEETFGPLDWRLPQTHAAYWAWKGMPYAEGFDRLAMHRMIFQSLADAYLNGTQVIMRDLKKSYRTTSHDLLPGALAAFDLAIEEHSDQATIQTAHRNFLQRAVLESWMNGEDPLAQELFDRLMADYGSEMEVAELDDLLCQVAASLYGGRSGNENLSQVFSDQAELFSSRGELLRAARLRGLINRCFSVAFGLGQ